VASQRFDIAAIGEPLYELNQQPDGRYLPGFGGDTLNVAIAASRLGSRSAYVTRLGDDFFADELMALMVHERIDVSAVIRDRGAPTGLYFVTHGPQGHVFTYRRKGSAASLMTAADANPPVITGAKFLHASGISQAISPTAADAVSAAIDTARGAGVRVSYDTNFRPRLWTADEARPVICAAAARADILKTSAEDSAALFGLSDPEAIARHVLGLGSKAVVVTLGREGVLLADGREIMMAAGHAVKAVDATGAGDAFTGAMLAELAAGHDMRQAVRFANAAAALSTLGYGAIAPLPDRVVVEAFLASR
jgi:2-dehydro-3-deoxygluconokinase